MKDGLKDLEKKGDAAAEKVRTDKDVRQNARDAARLELERDKLEREELEEQLLGKEPPESKITDEQVNARAKEIIEGLAAAAKEKEEERIGTEVSEKAKAAGTKTRNGLNAQKNAARKAFFGVIDTLGKEGRWWCT